MDNEKKIDENPLNTFSLKMDFLHFKNEVLKDIKNLEYNLSEKSNQGDIILKDEIAKINNNINSIYSKINELTTLITVDTFVKEKVDNLDKLKSKILDDILVNQIKINTLDKETRESITKVNNILNETVIYQGVIGPSCKHKTFHELIDFIINELVILGNYKDKNMMDLTSYKKKLDNIIQGFKFQIEGIAQSSTQLTLDYFNSCDEKINNSFHKCDDKIEEIQTKIEDNLKNINSKIDDLEIKLIQNINELKKDNIKNNNTINTHIEEYLIFKENFLKISDIVNKSIKPSKKKNKIGNSLDSNENEEENDKNNKSKIKRMKNKINNKINEELKKIDSNQFISKNKVYKNINSDNIISDYNKNEIEYKNSHNFSNDNINSKINSNSNLKINIDNSNLSGTSLNFEKASESMENLNKKSKNYLTFTGKNKSKKNNLYLSDLEEDEKISYKSPESPSINTKNKSKLFLRKQKKSNTLLSYDSQKSQKVNGNIEENKKSNDLSTEKDINRQNSKIKRNKNFFNKNLKKNNYNNNIWFSDYNKNRKVSIGNNTINHNLIKFNKKYSSTKYKNIILTLEGSKKLIIESKDIESGKRIYHMESLSEKNHPKIDISKRIASSRPFLIKRKYLKFPNDAISLEENELTKKIKNKNKKIIFLNKSESQNNLLKNKNNELFIENKNVNNKFEPSINITHYSPLYNNKIISIEDKNDKNIRNEDNSDV